MKKEEENTTKQTQGFDIILSRIIKIVSLCVVLFGVIFFIACKSFIPKYYYSKGYELNTYDVYEINGKEYSMQDLKSAANKQDMDFITYVDKLKEQKGLKYKGEDMSVTKDYYEKANFYWMIFSDKYYPGTEKVMESGNLKLLSQELLRLEQNNIQKLRNDKKYKQCIKRITKGDYIGDRCEMNINSKSQLCDYHFLEKQGIDPMFYKKD